MLLQSTAPAALVLSGLLAAACAHDLRARRIPNALVAATLGTGLARAAAVSALGAGQAVTLAPGLAAALLGAALGLVAWLPLYALGVLGAGDVKLFAAAAAWLGPRGVLPASTCAAVAGGALALVWVVFRARTSARPRDQRLPYGVAIAAGVLVVAWGAGT
jgi:prepilin peptidase CpaA